MTDANDEALLSCLVGALAPVPGIAARPYGPMTNFSSTT
jgi:hypothetical protein